MHFKKKEYFLTKKYIQYVAKLSRYNKGKRIRIQID